MTKLKTLEDFSFKKRKGFGSWVPQQAMTDLREELGMKWRKVIRNKINIIDELESKPQTPLQKVATRGLDEVLEGQIKLLNDIFNLDEEGH